MPKANSAQRRGRALRRLFLIVAIACCSPASPLAAQEGATAGEGPSVASWPNPAELRATLAWLAADERGGRDTPSPGLEATADHLAERLEKAGLGPGADAGYFHVYRLAGRAFAPSAITLRWQGGLLEGGHDVRLLGSDRALEALEVDREDTPAWLTIAEVAEDSHAWRAAGVEVMRQLDRTRGRVVVLIREGALPDDAGPLRIDAPEPSPCEIELRNVVGILRGAERPDEIVMLSAHYDHIGIGIPKEGDAVFNGADDDATGVTAVLHLAERLALREKKLARSVAFVFFSAEEKGLLGSQAFVASPPFPLDRIVCDLNFEMLGRPGSAAERNTAWFTGRGYSDLEETSRPLLEQGGVKLRVERMGAMLFRASDNWSLAQAGVVAHSISAGSLHEDYHQRGDHVEKIDFEHMARVVGGLLTLTEGLASSELRPAWNAAGLRAIGRAPEGDGAGQAAPKDEDKGGDRRKEGRRESDGDEDGAPERDAKPPKKEAGRVDHARVGGRAAWR